MLPDQAKERPSEGLALAVGPGRRHPHTGVLIPNPVKVGDSVLYGKFDGTKINYDMEDCNLIRDDDVIIIYKGAMMTLENVRPCKDYVLVKLQKGEMKTASGIALAASVTKNLEPCSGTVVILGEGRRASDGKLTESPVKVGDEVKFRDYAGQEVTIAEEDYVAVRMVDILSIMRD